MPPLADIGILIGKLDVTPICGPQSQWAAPTHAFEVCQGHELSCMQAVKKEVDTAVSEAKNSPIPEAEALWHHIYKDPLGSSVKGLDSKTHVKL